MLFEYVWVEFGMVCFLCLHLIPLYSNSEHPRLRVHLNHDSILGRSVLQIMVSQSAIPFSQCKENRICDLQDIKSVSTGVSVKDLSSLYENSWFFHSASLQKSHPIKHYFMFILFPKKQPFMAFYLSHYDSIVKTLEC